MSKETINISLVAGSNPPELYLSDSEGHHGEGNLTTNVNCGDKVIWEIVAESGISSISICRKRDSEDIFSKDPRAQQDGSWKGTVSNDATGEETYNIGYTVDGEDYVCDPILKINQ